ncbi:proton-translocating NADH-quinone oxidoreductase, chain M [Thermosinus carboxydivorans Nor1]|uniref:Proton-translocating NADH-quinone oxidoreductase, chain M n=1 Tax=Thermosinus carboxydivorans Nor1 TaxID=401526 RepID=A1HPU0_9FIRM|nr:NADH-quinone oxidoreductase subunit M [Thermosinus carboxydivorans]EAX48059.1 proton-translocating NADH-quinone oxidoreductase, chain M [Thermosinus carboxydivorans Nor1]
MTGFPILTTILLAPILGALALALLPKGAEKTIKIVAACAMGVSLSLSIYCYFAYDLAAGGMQFTENVPWLNDLGVTYAMGVDGISLPLMLLTTLIGFSAVFASWSVDHRPKEFFILLLILTAGVIGTFITRDLFIFLLFYELVVIPIYIMVIVWGSSKRVTKEYAGMKLTLYLLIGSAFMLVGVVALYLTAYPAGLRTFSMEALVRAHELGNLPEDFQIFAFFLLLIGFGSLLSMWPLHSWSPDGYAGAPTAVSMIHAGVLKKIGGYGLIRLGLLVLPLGAKFWAPLIALLGVANVVYAAFIAVAQKDMKYVVGYSSVSHMGFVLIGFAALNVIGLNGAVANMFAHGVMSALFFAMIGYVYEKTHTRHIPDLGGLAHQLPRVATGFMLAGMASLGLPGLIGFVPEFTIFVGAFRQYPLPTLLAITGIVLTALYTLRVLANVLFGPRLVQYDNCRDVRGPALVPLLALGSVLVVFGLFPGLLIRMVNSGVEPLLPLLAKLQDASAMIGGIFR